MTPQELELEIEQLKKRVKFLEDERDALIKYSNKIMKTLAYAADTARFGFLAHQHLLKTSSISTSEKEKEAKHAEEIWQGCREAWEDLRNYIDSKNSETEERKKQRFGGIEL